MNYTKHSLQKIEELFEELGYKIRYEKGSFQSGYCLVEKTRIVVVNKFYEIEGRINTLTDILDKLEIDFSENADSMKSLTEKAQKTLKEMRKKEVEKSKIEQ
ncbi:MAG: hypothetical protein HC817_10805 [Saprospiraceae bacterium]|nr:hypothetical protein [Saprospiraceae bacterium]